MPAARPPALSLQQQPSTMLHTGARVAKRVQSFAQICFRLHEQPGPQEWQLGPLPFRPAVTADPARPSGAQHSRDA